MKHALRKRLKHRAEIVLSSSGARWLSRSRRQNKRLILAYHGVVPDGAMPAGERPLHIAERDLKAHLDVLSELVEVVPLSRIDEPSEAPRVAITFDDAYHGAIAIGLPEIARRGLSATVFVAPGRLDRQVFWWDALAGEDGVVEESVRTIALTQFCGIDAHVRAWSSAAGLSSSYSLPEYARSATQEQLRAALSLPGISVGSHSWSHSNLAMLDSSHVLAEAESSYNWLMENCGEKVIPWLAYPYGLHLPETMRAVKSAGYAGALAIGGGWHSNSRESRFARPRLNVPAGLSVAGFKARVLGTLVS